MPYREESGLMSKSWGDIIIDPTRLRSNRPPPKAWRNIPLVEAQRIETEGLRWVAVKTAAKCERIVAGELGSLGYETYCPLGAKHVLWDGNRRAKERMVKQFPVFFGYIFVGLRPRQTISRYVVFNNRLVLAHKIHSILGDSRGPLLIPQEAIRELNDRELDSQWDQTKRSPFKEKQEIRILSGPFRGFYATVDADDSEFRIRALVKMFGRKTPVELDVDEVEAV